MTEEFKGRMMGMKRLLIAALVFAGMTGRAAGQDDKKMTAEEYIETYKDLAMEEMNRTGIPASITLSQGLIESSNGNSRLSKEANNHFGIKCRKDWTGRSINVDDDAPQECFRAYDRAEDSYRDHSDFLASGTRYAFLFQLEPGDYKGWAFGLKEAGYATNPRYPEMLITAIEKYNLHQYDANNYKHEPTPPLVDSKGQIIQHNTNTTGDILYNGIPSYVVKEGDNLAAIADAHKTMRFAVRWFNDLSPHDRLEPGTILYLKPKLRKAHEAYHTVKEGESMYYISQLHAIKLRRLYKLNLMAKGQEPAAGEKLNLQEKRSAAPKLLQGGSPIKKGVKPEQKTTPKKEIQQEKKEISGNSRQPVTTPRSDNPSKPLTEKHPADTQTSVTPTPTLADTEKNKMAGSQFHTVAAGESLFSISQQAGVKMQDLIDWNQLSELTLKPGQVLRIRKQAENSGEIKIQPDGSPKPSPENTDYYTVQPGETFYSLSKKLNLSIDSIKSWNGLTGNNLSAGQKLRIRPQSHLAVDSAIYHEVKQGETLYSISQLYGVSMEMLKNLNNLTDNSISLGQRLLIKKP